MKRLGSAILTDGLRYGIYLRSGDYFTLHTYLSLSRLSDSYPIHSCYGAKEALEAISPMRQYKT